jgi:type IV fimbrial biogenesis protein FimT
MRQKASGTEHRMSQHGTTLTELLLAVALMALLTAMALPSFSGLVQKDRLTQTSERLYRDLTHARAQAIQRGQPVALVAHPAGWDHGWTVFVDTNHNRQRETGESLLRDAPALPPGFALSTNAGIGGAIGYRGDGRSERPNGGLQMGTWLLCDGGGTATPGHAVTLVVSATGRARVSPSSDHLDGSPC